MRNPKAVIHVDLDGARDIYRCRGLDWSGDDDPIFDSGLPACLDFLDRHELKATLFVIARDVADPARRALLADAVKRGHEIASHSMTHPDLRRCGDDALRTEIVESREVLQQALGVDVRGFRAPSYSIDRRALEMVAEAGYAYDSSAYADSEFARRLQLPSLLPVPSRPLLDRDLVELPMPSHRPAPFPFHPSYGQVLGGWYSGWRLNAFRRHGHPLVFLFHLADFAEPLPAARLAGIGSKIFTQSHRSQRSKLKFCDRAIERVKRAFYVRPTAELVEEADRSRELVLGISTTHETGSALFDGHDCLAAISEERLDRVKFSTIYPPEKSIHAVIETAEARAGRITDVAVAGIPGGPLFRKMLRNQWSDTSDYHAANDYFPHFNKLLYRVYAWKRALGYDRVLGLLKRQYGIEPRLHFVPHHLCHAASAYRTAPFDDAMIVTADGVGDYDSMSISYGNRGRIDHLHTIEYPHSLGQFYTACTQVLGFKANRHEGKITGLSGFGKSDPELYRKVRSTIKESGPGFKLHKKYYSEGIIRGLGFGMMSRGESLFDALQYRNYKKPLARLLDGHPREDVAHVFQQILEEELVEIVRPFAEKTGARNLCLAGGIFANVKANAALFRALGFDNVYIYPNMGDGGLGPGAALELLQAEPTPTDSMYLGPSYDDERLRSALDAVKDQGLTYERVDGIEDRLATLLAEKNVIARFDGRMEFGPRALCNRTILYSTTEPEANDWLNKRLGRTEFMPFAPVVMAEHVDKLFVNMKGTEHACKFMTIILDCTEWMKENCPAVVHVDGTARPQFVTADINPSMHRILERYHEITGIPVLVNTSFNMHEEPIVCSPEDAVRAYLASGLDYLAIGPYLATIKSEADRDR